MIRRWKVIEMKIVLATHNRHKIEELKALLAGEPVEVLSLEDIPDLPDVEETGTTFAENALKKAREICRITGLPALADDSGLEVDLLNGAPGVYSARFSGPAATHEQNNRKLLELLRDHPDPQERTARFKSVIALVMPDGRERLVEGCVEGVILSELRGQQGFGYDPLFFVPGHQATLAELPLEIKNRISHRGNAFRKIAAEMKNILQNG